MSSIGRDIVFPEDLERELDGKDEKLDRLVRSTFMVGVALAAGTLTKRLQELHAKGDIDDMSASNIIGMLKELDEQIKSL